MLEAQFSAPYCLAVAASSGRATLDQFEPLRTGDAEVRRLMAATTIVADRVLGPKDYPSLEVVFKDGRRDSLDVPFAKGAPEAPISDEELVAKAMSLLAPVLGAARAQQVVDAVWALESCADFSAITALLALPAKATA
jgi:2-methylcitrate dehydratase PrpD